MAKERSERPARLSYLTAAISGALVLGLLAYLIVHAIVADRPAAITVEVVADSAWVREGLPYVAIDVKNIGDGTAAEVVIETSAPAPTPGDAPSTATTTIGYLAGGERQRIYVTLPPDVDRSRVAARVLTFQEP